MKLWKFYYKADKKDIAHDIDEDKKKKSNDEYINDKYPLYAFTNDKKLYKEFKEERNMDNFIVIKSDIDREDYLDYAETFRNSLLDQIVVSVKDVDGKLYDATFAVTSYEQIVIDDMDIEYILGDESHFMPYLIFNKEILKALKTLEYPFFYNLITGNDLEGTADYDQPNIKNNEFEILYDQFSGTFN